MDIFSESDVTEGFQVFAVLSDFVVVGLRALG